MKLYHDEVVSKALEGRAPPARLTHSVHQNQTDHSGYSFSIASTFVSIRKNISIYTGTMR